MRDKPRTAPNGFRERPAGKAPPDPSRNLAVERGRPVTRDEVRAHANPACRTCRTRGGLTPRGAVCACAQRRFLKAHPEVILDRVGMAWWPAARSAQAAEVARRLEEIAAPYQKNAADEA